MAVVLLLIRESKSRLGLNQQLIKFSERAQRQVQEQAEKSIACKVDLKGQIEQGQTTLNK